ncbi:MAG: metallophosphoesterase, partial [Candidatus Mariimomonas ferrooxydans]
MALLFFFFSISLSIDLYNLAIRLVGFILQKDLTSLMPAPLPSFYVPLVLSVLFSIYGYLEAKVLKVKGLSINPPPYYLNHHS